MAKPLVMADQSKSENWYAILLGMAELYRSAPKPNIRKCIHCLQAIFKFSPPPKIKAKTHLQLGTILYQHSKNIDLARQHFEAAWTEAQQIVGFDELKFEAISMWAQILQEKAQLDPAKPLLTKALEISRHSSFWHCRLLFQLGQLHIQMRNYHAAAQTLRIGKEYAETAQSPFTSTMFLLSLAMVLQIDRSGETEAVLTEAEQSISQFSGLVSQKESLVLFYYLLKLYRNLCAGKVKSAKAPLTAMQESFKRLMHINPQEESQSPNPVDQFQWLPREHLCILVYLVTVMHSMQAGFMDRAQRHSEDALTRLQNMKNSDTTLLSTFHVILLEHLTVCRIVQGRSSSAITDIVKACEICQQRPHLSSSHLPQLHTMLALYAMSTQALKEAEHQFTIALSLCRETDLRIFIYLNLAIIYLRTNREEELLEILNRTDPERMSNECHSLKASSYYIRGLQSFFQGKHTEAKKFLRETLKMSNAEDLNRLTSLTLVLLGHIFLSLGNSGESINMVTPAFQLATKIPDVNLQLWASSLLKELYHLLQNETRYKEGVETHQTLTQQLVTDQSTALAMSEHCMIQWGEGPIPQLAFPAVETEASLPEVPSSSKRLTGEKLINIYK